MTVLVLLRQLIGSVVLRAVMVAAFPVPAYAAADSLPIPGQYRVEVRIALPNLQNNAPPMIAEPCITAADLESGQAFSLLSDNPLRRCEMLDYEIGFGAAAYRIVCAGPNRGSAVANFKTTNNSFRGLINMNMGGKNMTMSETQDGKRIGECR